MHRMDPFFPVFIITFIEKRYMYIKLYTVYEQSYLRVDNDLMLCDPWIKYTEVIMQIRKLLSIVSVLQP